MPVASAANPYVFCMTMSFEGNSANARVRMSRRVCLTPLKPPDRFEVPKKAKRFQAGRCARSAGWPRLAALDPIGVVEPEEVPLSRVASLQASCAVGTQVAKAATWATQRQPAEALHDGTRRFASGGLDRLTHAALLSAIPRLR